MMQLVLIVPTKREETVAKDLDNVSIVLTKVSVPAENR
jgi:hypothetical protein